MKKVFLDNLPTKEGIGKNKEKRVFNWIESKGYKIKFIYENIEGYVEIIDYKKSCLYVKYLNNDIFKINTEDFKKCKLGGMLGLHIKIFKYNINKNIIDENRNITIIDREYRPRYKKNGSKCNDRYYKYHCDKCGNEDWILESNLVNQKIGCNACCSNHQKVVLGINTIWDTDRWMCDLGVSEEDAKIYTKCSHNKICVICPDCNRIKSMTISNINIYKSIKCVCKDGIKYPEKLMFSVLEQLEMDFKKEYSPNWCRYIDYKDINKIKTGRYDFKLNDIFVDNKQIIIETDGGFHSKNNSINGQTVEESKYIDNIKDNLAKNNGYEVIRIDCKKSDLEFIKKNILNSQLNKLFDLSKIDWNEAEQFALSNRVKEACNYKKENPDMSATEISNIMKLNSSTVRIYLHKGNKLGWCSFITN